jgi:hypothetical protein
MSKKSQKAVNWLKKKFVNNQICGKCPQKLQLVQNLQASTENCKMHDTYRHECHCVVFVTIP